MITVACVNAGNYENRGELYVDRLRSMVARHLKAPHRFEVIDGTAHDGGWWMKRFLFEPGRFEGRCLYIDLDSIIVDSLDELAETKGIIGLRDWGWDRDVYGSAVMCWDAGEHAEIFTRWTPNVSRRLEGDQLWITELGGWNTLPATWCRSYRYHCKNGPLPECKVVCFHGRPKNHELLPGHWALEYWQ